MPVRRFVLVFPTRGVDAYDAIERTETDCRRENGDEAEQRPPAQSVHTKKQQAATREKPNACVVGSDVGFHDVGEFPRVYPPWSGVAAHLLAKAARGFLRRHSFRETLNPFSMPSFPLVDSHVHLWDPERLRYGWLAGVPALNRSQRPEEYRLACGPVAVAKFVFVQCECDPTQSQAEVDWVTGVAAEEPRLRGIVAQAALEYGSAIKPALERLAANPLVKGVRRLLQEEKDDAFCVRPEFVRGVQLLARHGLSFDLCIYHRQLSSVIKLVRQCPDVRFVLDHIGKPDIKSGALDPWRAELRELAQLENVGCKLSGLVTEADWSAWTPADLRPYLDHAVDCFGVDRVMFGSDWPVCAQATDYARWVATLDNALRGCSMDELHRVYVRNAEAFYRL